MNFQPLRSSGLLLHPTSLPGPYGIGDLGPEAYAWVDTLVRAKQKWWQVLPLGPTGYGDSPYQSFSAFAGNPYLISPDRLIADGLLKREDLGGVRFPAGRVDFGAVIPFKVKLLARAWENFQAGAAKALRPLFDSFCAEQISWLDDLALFMALKEAHSGASWLTWEPELARRRTAALNRAQEKLGRAADRYRFQQFLFFRQWNELKTYANAHGVQIIGDAPLFVSSDSADVWAQPQLFHLDKSGRPTVVAGVPPDYFSPTGQLWGNPLYDWKAARRTDYAWWLARLRAMLRQFDLVRLDHFRGFEAYWEIPADQLTAEVGRWVKGPGAALFDALRATSENDSSALPILAEDLGVITPEVEALRDGLSLPGMKVLQFAWGDGPENLFLPHNFSQNSVVYTGTHDNDTTRGWYATASEKERDFCRRYLGRDGADISWDFIRLAWASVALVAIAPVQDVLALGSEARMNLPGTLGGNWSWRYSGSGLTEFVLERLGQLTELYGR